MADIILTTLNARYAHAAFGLRYLLANLGELRPRAAIVEFDISRRPLDVVEAILEHRPKIVGLGVYIWNVSVATHIVADLKRAAPDVMIVLGGAEVSHETDRQEICRIADYVIRGEGDLAFADLCRQLLAGRPPAQQVIDAPPPDVGQLVMPYDLYDDTDIRQRVVYVEASRGCPFECEFCLSSLDHSVRAFPLEPFLGQMRKLLDRGLRQFKFVDRTFNLNINSAAGILRFFLDNYRPGLFLHFEIIPDRLPDELRELIRQFPAGAMQFEVGIQTFNEQVAERISRRQDNHKAEENLRWLATATGVHVHADLIAGLPGEDLASFARGFDRLLALGPQEIQLGILKRLRGAPIARHDAEWGMVYSPNPPYEVLATRLIDFSTMQGLRRLARYWDLVANSGNFIETTPLILQGDSPFANFRKLADFMHAATGQTHAISLHRLAELVFKFLTETRNLPAGQVGAALCRDYHRIGRQDTPEFLRPYIADPIRPRGSLPAGHRRQSRHTPM